MSLISFSTGRRSAALIVGWFLLSLFISFFPVVLIPEAKAEANLSPSSASTSQAVAPSDFFGIVGRDPWYDFNTDPKNPGQPNLAFEENMAQQLSQMGAHWIRIEFHVEAGKIVPGGFLDLNKYDAFINNIAPRYNLKVLALLGSGTVKAQSAGDANLDYSRINDFPDQSDGTNPYIRFFSSRVKSIADHYGDKISAYELLNEPNYWNGFTADPERVGSLMTLTYGQTKLAHPAVKFILGGIAATGKIEIDHADYLGKIYQSKAVQKFKTQAKHSDNNPFPFDGVAWHPYYPEPWISLYTTDQAIQVMRQMGDSQNKIWITETGVFGSFENSNCVVDSSGAKGDEDQAQFLRILYTQAALRQSDIAAVFWFKYEDFYDKNQVIPYGLVHLETNAGTNYNPSFGKVIRYKPAYLAYQVLAAPTLPTTPVAVPAEQNSAAKPNAPYYFPQTGHTLSGLFLNYWLKNGGLALFGFPLTEAYKELDPSSGKVYTVQWFERERFELHPENAGTKYEVLLGLLGNESISRACRSFDPSKPLPPSNNPSDQNFFPETRHNLEGAFKSYWEKRGGLAILGYPISEEFGEVNLADGKFYVVQYFERARLEYHPENKGTPYEVELGLLGNQMLATKFKR